MITRLMIMLMTFLSASTLVSCASIVHGTHQKIAVRTTPIEGATCVLKNDKGTWQLTRTPGTVLVDRSFKDLKINCSKKGFKNGYSEVISKTAPIAFGNLVSGGVIGAGIDVANGAAFDYPSEIQINMKKIA